MMEPRQETWDSFWARTTRIDFFAGKWDMYNKVADARAAWLEQTFQLDKSKPVLSLACGEGGIEIALAHRGYKVTGIDRSRAFIHHARAQATKENLNATFLVGNLRSDTPLTSGNGLVYCFDTFGLLNGETESKVLERMVAALSPDGVLLVDSPQRETMKPSRNWWPLNSGYLLVESRWDAASGVQHIEPVFIEEDGERVVLADPYDEAFGNETGISRYIYQQQELVQAVESAGLSAQAAKHQRGGYYMVVGSRSVAQPETEGTFAGKLK